MDFLKKSIFKGNIFSLIRKITVTVFLMITALGFTSKYAVAQDATFSQYYASALYLNPAFAAAETRLSASGNFRTQWKSIVTPYVTNQISLIVPIKTKGVKERHLGGIGLSLFNHNAGDGNFKTLGANINIGYNLALSSLHQISFGLQGGFVQKSISLGDLQWGSQYNPLIGGYDPNMLINVSSITGSTSFSDFGAGIMYYFNPARDYEEKGVSIYLGGAAYHLTRPNESMLKDSTNRLPILFKSHAGFEVNISEKFNFSPNVFVAMQNELMQINTGAYLTFHFGDKEARAAPSFLLLGGWYRLDDSFIFSAGIGNAVYTIGFSYDLNNSSLRYNTQGKGAYEISLKIQKPSSNKSIRIYNPML